MLWLKLLKKLFKALNADASPSEIAGGVILGSVLGLTPVFALHNLLVIVLIIILKVNISAAVFSSIVFSIIGYAADPGAHVIGRALLLSSGLNGLWTLLSGMPVIPLTRFNNTVVLGSLVISLIIMVPLFIFAKKFVVLYREKIQEKIQKLKIVKIMKASKIYNLYQRIKG
jgi:uncharacterized protein (TIGR03546 family)